MRVRAFSVLFAAFLILAWSGVAWSQTVQGVIAGTITDPTGAVVPNATVTITKVGANISQTTTTGSGGSYRFPLVPPGTYTVEVKAENFATVRVSGIVVGASQTVPFSRQLELATARQVIEVTASTPLVQTMTSDLSIQINRATIQNAPLVDRDIFQTLPFLAPSVSQGVDQLPTSGGARESGTTFLLNGADSTNNYGEGSPTLRPPLESVEDFTIFTNSMSAQYGRGGGAVVSANQKSGSNKFHGVLYEFNRNASLNAEDFFSNRAGLKKPKYIRNQFGGEVDGPIRRDKTFFSFAYDHVKLLAGTTSANTFVPTSAAIAGVKANGAPLAQQVLAARPPVTSDAPCPGQPAGTTGAGTGYWGNGLPNPIGCLSFSSPKTDTEDSYYGRVDHIFSSKDRLSFAANVFRQTRVDKYGGAPLTTNGPVPNLIIDHFHHLVLSETHVYSPRLLNEVTISHNRHSDASQEGAGQAETLPQIFILNVNGGFMSYSLGGQYQGGQVVAFNEDRWGGSDNLTWTVGRHSVRFGGGAQWGILYRNYDLGAPGFYQFGELDSINTGGMSPTCPVGAQITALCDGTLQPDGTITNLQNFSNSNFTNDYPQFEETSIDPRIPAPNKADAYRHYNYREYFAFVQDDWKVTKRLTLNLGLRWDRYGAPTEVNNLIGQFTNLETCDMLQFSCIANARVRASGRMWKPQSHDFGPRVGFAWDPTGSGKMAVRGSYGIYYDRVTDNVWSNSAWNPPFYALLDANTLAGDAIYYSIPASIGPAYDPNGPNGPVPYPGKRTSVRTMQTNLKDLSSQNIFLGVEREFFGGLLVRVNYQASLGRHLPMLQNLNRVDGDGYYDFATNPPTIRSSQSPTPPNPLYTGFNFRMFNASSNYNALVVEAQKRPGHGLQFQVGYTWSKLLDVNSEIFSGDSPIGGLSSTYYYITNTNYRLNYGPGTYDHRHAFKFSVTYEVPFLKKQQGFAGHALGGWTIASFFQYYSGHPIDVYNGRSQIRARNGSGVKLFDQNGAPINIGGDYNLDGWSNDHPNFIGSSVASAYSGGSPADGIFIDNNRIGCGEAGVPSTVNYAASGDCPSTPNTLFANPDYPTTGTTPYERFGNLGRGVFRGPGFAELDLSLSKTFKLTETIKLEFRAQAQNALNHPSFEGVDANLDSGTFGRAQLLAQQGLGGIGLGQPVSRIVSLGLRLSF